MTFWLSAARVTGIAGIAAIFLTPRAILSGDGAIAGINIAARSTAVAFIAWLAVDLGIDMSPGTLADVVGRSLIVTLLASLLGWAVAIRTDRHRDGLTITPTTAITAGFLGGFLAALVMLQLVSIVLAPGPAAPRSSTAIAFGWGAGVMAAVVTLVLATAAGAFAALRIHRTRSHHR